jgi:hypothetical protein
MSVVTGVVLTASVCDEECIPFFNEWFKAHDYARLVSVDQIIANDSRKHPQMVIAGGGYNYLLTNDVDDLRVAFQEYKWNHPHQAVLVMTKEDEECVVVRPSYTAEDIG